ncbi:hypothetical protein [Oryza sativa Japonica Group]|uniref:Uncharacterized protein n=1 Tax=Oryza sativa subsp. japonica TaxID=39947 RepID=Q8LR66_ORYSJ|nr:hypothetical protein [Oryza sativa Japonica Group]
MCGSHGAVLGEAAVTARSGPLRPDLAGRQLAAARVAATTAGMELAEGAEAAAVPPRSAPLGRIWRVEAVGRRQLATTTTTAGGSRRWSRPDLDAGGSGRRRRQCGDGSGGGRGPAATWWLPCHLATAVEAMASGCYLLGGGGRWRNGGFAEAVVGVGGSGDGGCDSRGGDDVGGGEGVGCEVGMMTARETQPMAAEVGSAREAWAAEMEAGLAREVRRLEGGQIGARGASGRGGRFGVVRHCRRWRRRPRCEEELPWQSVTLSGGRSGGSLLLGVCVGDVGVWVVLEVNGEGVSVVHSGGGKGADELELGSRFLESDGSARGQLLRGEHLTAPAGEEANATIIKLHAHPMLACLDSHNRCKRASPWCLEPSTGCCGGHNAERLGAIAAGRGEGRAREEEDMVVVVVTAEASRPTMSPRPEPSVSVLHAANVVLGRQEPSHRVLPKHRPRCCTPVVR